VGSESASLSRQHSADFRDLKRFGRSGTSFFGMAVLSAVAVIIALFISFWARPEGTRALRAQPDLQSDWVVGYLDREQSLSDFLWYFGIPPERWIFNRLSDSVLSSGSGWAEATSDSVNPPISHIAILSVHRGILNLLFFLLISWRAWVAYVIWVWVKRSLDRGTYEGRDLLGQMGNGRLFYSGARAGLFKMADNGAPDVQVRGLACPPEASQEAVLSSSLFKVLERYGALSETNKTLISYILADPRIPAFASGMSEDRVIERVFEGGSLIEITEVALERALYLHGHYLDGTYDDDSFYEIGDSESDSGGITVERYAHRLLLGFHRVLTDSYRDALRTLTPAQVATIILALEAGKVLAYSFEGGRWVRVSCFPELCARAVLHSVAAFGDESSFYEREFIRQAIIYGSRFSLMGPIRFPLTMAAPARAARQWVEILLADPHELATSIDEVELVGIVAEVHTEWSARLVETLQRRESTVVQGTCIGPSEVVFMPVRNLLAQMREILPRQWIERIGDLVALVSQKQRLLMMAAELNAEGAESKSVPAYQRILPPLSFADRKKIGEEFGLDEQEVKDWCALRVVLNSNGWLARRVGNRAVPDSSVIFCILKIEHDHFPLNDKGRAGLEAVVPLRGSRLEARLGRGWASLFPEASMAKLAESRQEYQLFLEGKKKKKTESSEDGSDGGDGDAEDDSEDYSQADEGRF